MRFWSKSRDSRLERRLHAERPQAREEFVQMLAPESPAPKAEPRRSTLPRVAVVAAVTAVLAASLGVAGAIGYATNSLHSLSSSIAHVVQPSTNSSHGSGTTTSTAANKQNGSDKHNGGDEGNGNGNNNGGQGNGGNNGDQGNGGHGDDDEDDDPFHHVYGIKVPICHDGHIIFVPIREYFYRLLHGDHPALYCILHHH